MNIKNLYIAYNFFKDGYKWLSKKEMIFDYNGRDNTPITIEFLSSEEWIERFYYKNGNIQSEIPYKNEKSHGLQKIYYENGNIRQRIPYKYGKAHGIVKDYYKNGNILWETPYKNDKRYGIEKYYHENGNIKCETPYENGKKQ